MRADVLILLVAAAVVLVLMTGDLWRLRAAVDLLTARAELALIIDNPEARRLMAADAWVHGVER